MKKKLENIIIIILILVITFEVLKESNLVIESVKFSFKIWTNNIFPSLFPFLIIGNILISLNFHEIIGNLLKNITQKLFKINKYASFVIILSIISGFPSSSKYVKELNQENLIDNNTTSRLLWFTHFSNPLFVLGSVATFVGDKTLGFPILISHYLGNLVIAIATRKYGKNEKNTISKQYISENSFGKILSNSIANTIDTLLLILGSVTIFLVLTSLMNNIFNFSNVTRSIFNGIFEITNGLKHLEYCNIPNKIKGLIAVGIISFGGLSVHLQTMTIISNEKIKYFPYFICRIAHSIISMLIFYLWKVL